MIKLTDILEEIASKRLQYLREADAEKKPAKPRKKKPAAEPVSTDAASEPTVEPVAEPSEQPSEPTAGASSDSLKRTWNKYKDNKEKKEKEEAEKKHGKIPSTLTFHFPPTPVQKKRGDRMGMLFPVGTIKPTKLSPQARSSMQMKSAEDIAKQRAADDKKYVEPGQTPDAPKSSVADELQAYFRSQLKKADDKDAANDKKMQAILDREKTKRPNRPLYPRDGEVYDDAMKAADMELGVLDTARAERRASELAKRKAKQAAGKIRIKTGNLTDPDTDERSKKDYITDPKTGLLVLPGDDPTNLDIRQFDPKAVDAVSTAYQKYLRYNPSASEAENYLRLLLKKNKLPPQLGTSKQSKKFSGGNNAV